MTNQEKLKAMGFDNLPRGGRYKIFVSETMYFDESKAKYIKHLTNLSEWNPDHVYHNADSCLAIQEAFDYLGAEIEIHYSNMGIFEAMLYCIENGIKVIARSATFSFQSWRDNERNAVEEFIASGGIFVASAGNNFGTDNSPTEVDNEYFISVGCVNYPDNSNSTIVVYSGLSLQEFVEGADNIYTDTSGATYGAATLATVMSAKYGYKFEQFREWIIKNGRTDIPNLEEGERLLNIPVLEIPIVEVARFKVGSLKATVNGDVITLDQAPTIVRGTNRTLMPVRAVLEGLGYKVDWLAKTGEIVIYGDGNGGGGLMTQLDVEIKHG